MQKTSVDIFYSIIIPVFNRPEEIETVLACLSEQLYTKFEVIIVESGSTNTSEKIVEKYQHKMDVHWFMYKNDGQGYSRNFGMSKAVGDYFIIFDSDILIDLTYLSNLNQHFKHNYLDAFGGPDRFHMSFSETQKAVDHVMTSLFTTGGIRGNKKHVGQFYPRSFNMGFSREVYEKTKGYKWPFFGEDIELSKRIMSLGFKVGLVPEAYIYHKRKPTLKGHWKQMHFFGKARINIYKAFPDTLKLTHFFPAIFTFFCLLLLSFTLFSFFYSPREHLAISWLNATLNLGWFSLIIYLSVIFLSGAFKYNSILVGLISIPATFTQMVGYGTGFMKDFVKRVIFRKEYNFRNKD